MDYLVACHKGCWSKLFKVSMDPGLMEKQILIITPSILLGKQQHLCL